MLIKLIGDTHHINCALSYCMISSNLTLKERKDLSEVVGEAIFEKKIDAQVLKKLGIAVRGKSLRITNRLINETIRT